MPELQFERRLTSVLMTDAERAVRPIDAVSIAVGAVHAAPAPRITLPLRWLVVAGLLVATTAVAVAIVAGLLREAPVVVEPNRRVALDADGWLLGATTWLADTESIEGLGIAGRVRLVLGYGGNGTWVAGSDGRARVASRVVPGLNPGELQLVLIRDGEGCRAGDAGVYRVTAPDDGLSVDITRVSDACPARAAALERTWHRTLQSSSSGGTGLIDAFDPMIRVTVPAGDWVGLMFRDGFSIGDRDQPNGLTVVKDPQGLADPCVEDGGGPVRIAPGVAAFEAYLEALPGVAVSASDSSIGGVPARRVVATWERAPRCLPTLGMVAWRVDQSSLHRVDGGLTGTDVIYLVEAGGSTLVITAGPNGEALQALDLAPSLAPGTGPL